MTVLWLFTPGLLSPQIQSDSPGGEVVVINIQFMIKGQMQEFHAGFIQFDTKGVSTKNLMNSNLSDLDLKVRIRILKTAITQERGNVGFSV